MCLDDIHFSASEIAVLYKKSLIDSGEVNAFSAPAKEIPAGYKFLGKNQKKITIITNSPGNVFLPEDQLAFLTKMLEACALNLGDVALVNHAATPVEVGNLKAQLQPLYILLFGPEPIQIELPINFPQYKIQQYDGCTYLFLPALDEITAPGDAGKLLKSKLWLSLKSLFGI